MEVSCYTRVLRPTRNFTQKFEWGQFQVKNDVFGTDPGLNPSQSLRYLSVVSTLEDVQISMKREANTR